MAEMTPQKAAAKALMEREFMRIGTRWQQMGEDQLDLMRQRRDMEDLWRLAGLGEPPAFAPSMPALTKTAS